MAIGGRRRPARSPIVLAYWFLGEPIGWEQIVGAALVMSGVLLISVKPKPRPVPAPAD